MKPDENKKVLESWQVSSRYWDKYRVLIAEMFSSLTSGLIEEAGIRTGQRVIDIGGGSGEPSLTISSVVGSTGSIMYTDPAAGMVEGARAEAGRRGLTNIQFTQCSADDLPFANGAFDVAVSRLSVMFFPDPIAGVREVLRVIVENGPVSFVVWGAKEVNPFFSVVNDVMDRFVPLEDKEDPDAPDAFRFSTPGKLAKVLSNAGAKNVVERRLDFQIEAAISFDQFWQLRTEMSESLRRQIAHLTTDRLPLVKQTVADGAKRFFAGAKMSFPAEALIVTGRRGED